MLEHRPPQEPKVDSRDDSTSGSISHFWGFKVSKIPSSRRGGLLDLSVICELLLESIIQSSSHRTSVDEEAENKS